nr:hypothetical protein [uncultured Dyadobacter sp.]
MTSFYKIALILALYFVGLSLATAQLTVFNVPSSEITDRGRLSFQHQFEISHQKGRLTMGVSIHLSKRLPLSLGWQRMNSDGSQAAVVQLTVLPK